MSFISRLFGGGEQPAPAKEPTRLDRAPASPTDAGETASRAERMAAIEAANKAAEPAAAAPPVAAETPAAPQGPTAAERALQQDQARLASRANAEADERSATLKRLSGLRKALSYRDRAAG